VSSTPNSIAPEPGLPDPRPIANGEYQVGPNEGFQTLETSDSAPTPATAPSGAARTPSQGASLRWNFSWTFVGNVIYSGCQWAMLVALAKVGNPEMVGQYGLAMAIATPVLALSTLQLRAVLTTDVRKRIHFG